MRLQAVLLSLLSAVTFNTHAQYTETINSNRPGESQGAFAVGTGVLQLETGPYTGNDDHSLYKTETDIFGVDYGLRFGLLTETFEINLTGSYHNETTRFLVGNQYQQFEVSNFKSHSLGAKYLVYDPYKNMEEEEPNLYSWKAQQKSPFEWKKLIPAVSVYGGANFSFWDNPFLYEDESKITPKAALITQNNWGQWVLVLNFIADKFTEENPTYAGIATLTHAINPKFAIFGEYQGIISDLYADDIARAGAAYLITDNFQFDISGLVNFKSTPSRWQAALGLSYRLDMHKQEEYLEDSYDGDRRRSGDQQGGIR